MCSFDGCAIATEADKFDEQISLILGGQVFRVVVLDNDSDQAEELGMIALGNADAQARFIIRGKKVGEPELSVPCGDP